MKLSEAAQVLGVDQNADKQTIDKAARQQIRKWHPDRWRNASEEEQKKAAEEYSKVSKAQKTLQHPETADPEVSDIPSRASQAYGGGYGPTTDPYASGGYSANGEQSQVQYEAHFNPSQQEPMRSPFDDIYPSSSGGNQRAKYNSARDFEDSFGVVPDTMEQTLNMTHNASTERQYKQFADVMKLSMSVISSLVLFLASFILLLASLHIVNVDGFIEPGSLGAGITSILPAVSGVPSVFTFGILTILALVKIMTYDAFIAPLLANKIDALVPSVICGIDIFLCGLIGYAVSSAWPVPRLMYGVMMFIGIIFVVTAFLIKTYRESR